MQTYLWDLLFSFLGCLLGGSGLFGLFFYLQKRRISINETQFLEYKNVAQELAELLDDLLSLSFIPSNYTDEELDTIADNLSAFYFKYYLILPQSVLHEIQCLHSCLHHKGKRLFMPSFDVETNIFVQKLIDSKEQQINFIKDTSLMLRYDVKSIVKFYQKYPERIPDTFLKCQARHIIVVLDREWDLRNMGKWSEKRKKRTILMQEHL